MNKINIKSILSIVIISLISHTGFAKLHILQDPELALAQEFQEYFEDIKQEADKPEITEEELDALVIEDLDQNGMEDLRLKALEEMSVESFADHLNYLFKDIGGEGFKHWAYNPLKSSNELHGNTYYHKDHDHSEGFDADHFYITKAARASQYIIFFLEHNTMKMVKKLEPSPSETGDIFFSTVQVEDKSEQKVRAAKLAEVLNSMDEDTVIEMLYGRFDARFMGDRDRLTHVTDGSFYNIVDNSENLWSYQTYTNGWHAQNPIFFERNTVEARVPLKFIRLLVPYLDNELLLRVQEEEDMMANKRMKKEL